MFCIGALVPLYVSNRAKGVHEIGVIERYAAVISGLDQSLDPREGDEFLSWLRSQGFDADRASGGDEGGATAEGCPAGDGGIERDSDGAGEAKDGAKRRAEVEAFLSAAAARLNALVAGKEESLFGDRGKEEAAVDGDGDGGDKEETAATGTAAVSPNMSEEDLYQVRGVDGEALLELYTFCTFFCVLPAGKVGCESQLVLQAISRLATLPLVMLCLLCSAPACFWRHPGPTADPLPLHAVK